MGEVSICAPHPRAWHGGLRFDGCATGEFPAALAPHGTGAGGASARGSRAGLAPAHGPYNSGRFALAVPVSARIYIYDTTLRDGAQTQGVSLSVADKLAIARELDALGVDYIEGGWPGANPTDDALFAAAPSLRRARLVAFGMTRRPGRACADDGGLAALLACGAPVVCLVGKAWDFHVEVALRTSREENLAMIGESVRHAVAAGREVVFDAEHFFDGYRANPAYARRCVEAALDAGARFAVLCDTNGGTLAHEVADAVGEMARHVPGERLGIHCHDDTGHAVANSIAAVRAGVRHVQGTVNGLGERCGNANLVSILPTLILKLGFTTGLGADDLARLTHVSRAVDERLNRPPDRHAPYVGENAFAHKGGLHVSAVEKDPRSYEHIAPEQVGNSRRVLVSHQAGRAGVLARLAAVGIDVAADDGRVTALVQEVKARELRGYTYDGAEASFELLARRRLGELAEYYRVESFRVLDEHRGTGMLAEATVKLRVGAEVVMAVAEGDGPVNALDNALRRALEPAYPMLADLTLADYKVRILDSAAGTAAGVRVLIESMDGSGARWTTVGASTDVMEASYQALADALVYRLFRAGVPARPA
jgi:2-isopropylmalate synthase